MAIAKRPKLTDTSFLAHVFSPKKSAQPTGLRKTQLSGKQWDKTRLRAFNKMPAVNQEILKRAGLRDAYLRKQASLTDARKALRPKAVTLGVAKPARTRAAATPVRMTALDIQVRQHLLRTIKSAGRSINPATVAKESQYLVAQPEMLTWDMEDVRRYGRDGSELEWTDNQGQKHNPLWYH